MKNHVKIISSLLSLCMVSALAVPASANSLDPEACTGRGTATLVGESGTSQRITTNIGDCGGEWNSTFDWGRAYTGVWDWGTATYLYAEATVTANGVTSQTKTKSSTNSSEQIKTDKIYQSTTDGRKLTTSHIVRGYWGSVEDGDYKNESYSGEWEF